MIHGTDCTLWNSIHVESCGVCAYRFLVCSASPVQTATGGSPGAIASVWLFIIVGMLDTINAIIQSVRDSVFNYALGVNWVIVTIYVPALLVSSLLIFIQLLRPNHSPNKR